MKRFHPRSYNPNPASSGLPVQPSSLAPLSATAIYVPDFLFPLSNPQAGRSSLANCAGEFVREERRLSSGPKAWVDRGRVE